MDQPNTLPRAANRRGREWTGGGSDFSEIKPPALKEERLRGNDQVGEKVSTFNKNHAAAQCLPLLFIDSHSPRRVEGNLLSA